METGPLQTTVDQFKQDITLIQQTQQQQGQAISQVQQSLAQVQQTQQQQGQSLAQVQQTQQQQGESLAQVQQSLAQVQQSLAQNGVMLAQVLQALGQAGPFPRAATEEWVRTRGDNMHKKDHDRLTPVPNLFGTPPPANFPTTPAGISQLAGAALTTAVAHYLPAPPVAPPQDLKNLLLKHVGVYNHNA